jgi:hypothetical protein
MKKLRKLEINPGKLIKNEELMTLRGGFGVIKCFRSWLFGGDCILSGEDVFCDSNDMLFCAFQCPGSWGSVCVGGEGY